MEMLNKMDERKDAELVDNTSTRGVSSTNNTTSIGDETSRKTDLSQETNLPSWEAEYIQKQLESSRLEAENNARKEAEAKIKTFRAEHDVGLNNLKEDIEKLENKQINIIETIGLFIALFTFISTEFQAFKIYQELQAIAGLTLIMLGALLAFVIFLDFILKIDLPITKTKIVPGVMSSFLRLQKTMVDREEDIAFSWFKRSTWGSGVKTKYLPLMVACILFIILGAILLSTSPRNYDGNAGNQNIIIQQKQPSTQNNNLKNVL